MTHGVVTPNIVAPISGRSPSSGAGAFDHARDLPAAFARIRAEIRLTPAMSTTEYIIDTSTAPTYGRVSPEATVETISFGTPTGSARIAKVTSEEPPDPPSPRIPSSLPSACRRFTTSAAPRPIVSTAAPRSPAAASAATSAPAAARDLLARDVGTDARLAQHAGVDEDDVHAVREQPLAQKPYSCPFVSRVPSRTTDGRRS